MFDFLSYKPNNTSIRTRKKLNKILATADSAKEFANDISVNSARLPQNHCKNRTIRRVRSLNSLGAYQLPAARLLASDRVG